MSLVTVHLHGELGAKYGSPFEFDIRTSIEAVRALSANFAGFKKDFAEESWIVKVGERKTSLSMDEVEIASCQGELHLIPAIAGAKDGNDQVLMGIGLIAMAVFVPMLANTTYGALAGAPAFLAHTAMQIGVGIALSGIAAAIMAPDDPNSTESEISRTSHQFNGPVNTTAQGRPIPVGYGRCIVGSHVISAGITNEDERW